jgi:SAM-dependent methyltransferase
MIQSYDPAFFDLISVIEDRHFWFRSRNSLISSLVKQITREMEPGYLVLEVGCGTGKVLNGLHEVCSDGVVIGMDLFFEGLKHARKRTSCHLVRGDVQSLPFAKKFNLIGLFDVLEHLPDDMNVLADLHSILTEDGPLILTVPAHPSLWSNFDESSHHCRRYKLDELKNKLILNGYQVEYLTYYMASIFPFIWLERKFKGLIDTRSADDQSSDELRIVPVVNEIFAWLLAQEARLITGRKKMPFGSSLIAIARRTKKQSIQGHK